MSVISCSLSPNTESDDVWLAFRYLFLPWTWARGAGTVKVESWFRKYLNMSTAVSFNSGRSAELAILRAFGIGRGDEVIVQAFTCVAVPNSVKWAGATPVYADIDESYNIGPADFRKNITNKTKAVIIQHTFGIPAKLDELVAMAKKNNVLVIEDCAHGLGATYKGKKVGTFGDAAFFSFGRDKVVSSVFGGLAVIGDKHKVECERLKAYHKKLAMPSFGWIFQQLFHPVAFSFILPLYRLGVGKVFLVIFQRLRLLSFPVYKEEKSGRQPADFPAKYPNVLAVLLLTQLKKLERFNNNRRQVAGFYAKNKGIQTGAIYLRYPHLVDDAASVMTRARSKGIYLGNWYHNVVDPTGVAFAKVGYKIGSCPRAERAASHIINLPTRISDKAAKRVLAAQ